MRLAWEADLLSRKPIADAFEHVANSTDGGGVFLVHAGFGMGKTFFVENWHSSLLERGIPVLLFDAWRNDFFETPLTGFLSTLHEQLEQQIDPEKRPNLVSKLKEFSLSAAPFVLKGGVRVGARLLSLGIIDGDVDKVREVLTEEGVSLAETTSKELVDSFLNASSQRKIHEALRDDFSKIVDELLAEPKDQMIILIDELDRCRPDFSFSLLEDIKQFLDIPKVNFFVFCDEDVLQAQASKIFGDKTSGEKYVSKFHSHKLKIPETLSAGFIEVFASSIELRIEDHQVNYLRDFLSYQGASVRQAAAILNYLKVAFSIHESLMDLWPVTFVLAAAREINLKLYLEFSKSEPVSSLIEFDNDPNLIWAVNQFLRYQNDERPSEIADRWDVPVGDDIRALGQLFRNSNAFEMRSMKDVRSSIYRKLEFVDSVVGS